MRIFCRCWWRRLYWRLYALFLLPVRRNVFGGIYLVDQVTATLRDKDGNVIRRIVGPKIHNKWTEGGLDSVALCLQLGASAAAGLKGEYMRLGSNCSDTSFTYIDPSEESTVNTHPAVKQVTFTADWAATPEKDGICQALLKTRSYTGSGNIDAAIYSFGTQFNKPSGVSLEIAWTTTLSS